MKKNKNKKKNKNFNFQRNVIIVQLKNLKKKT